jgi:hypothetical protein
MLRRAAAALGARHDWLHFESEGEHVLGAPGTEFDEDLEEFVSPQEILHISLAEGRIEWESVAKPGEAEAEARSWSQRGRSLRGVDQASSFANVIQAAVAAVEASPEPERCERLADALTLLDHPLSWTLGETEEDEEDAEDSDEREAWPGQRQFERLTRPLMVLARDAGEPLAILLARRGVPRGTQLEYAFIHLAEPLAALGPVANECLRALFSCRHTDAMQEAWEDSMNALGLAARTNEDAVRALLDEVDPLEADEEHAWAAGVLERSQAEWARLSSMQRALLAEQAGDWETAITYADVLAEYPCDDSAAFLRAMLTRYEATKRPDRQAYGERAGADLQDALTLAEGRPLRFEGITIPPRGSASGWIAPSRSAPREP